MLSFLWEHMSNEIAFYGKCFITNISHEGISICESTNMCHIIWFLRKRQIYIFCVWSYLICVRSNVSYDVWLHTRVISYLCVRISIARYYQKTISYIWFFIWIVSHLCVYTNVRRDDIFSEKMTAYIKYMRLVSHLCEYECLVRSDLWENDFIHMVHVKGFLFVSSKMRYKIWFVRKCLHTYGTCEWFAICVST